MRRVLLVVAGILLAGLIATQLLLPGLAADRLRTELDRQGSDVRVEVEAFPAVKLLWGRADRVTVVVANLRPEVEEDGGAADDSLPDLIARTEATKELDVHVNVLHDRLLRMQDVRLLKDGDALTAVVTLRTIDVDRALPARLRLTDRAVPDGLAVAGVTDVFGERIEVEASIFADDDGSLVLEPRGLLLGDLASVPIFEDERVAVDSISARDTGESVVIVTARGHLR